MESKIEPFPIPLTDDQQFEMWKMLFEKFNRNQRIQKPVHGPEAMGTVPIYEWAAGVNPSWLPPEEKAEWQLYTSLTIRYACTLAIVSVVTEDLESGVVACENAIPK